MKLSAINKKTAYIGLFDGGEGADGGEFFDADFTFSWTTEAGGVENLEIAIIVAESNAVDVACGAGAA